MAVRGQSRVHPHLTTMDTLTGSLAGSDMDAEMTALTPEETTEQNFDTSDEVEHLQNRYTCHSYSCILDFITVLFCGISIYSIVSYVCFCYSVHPLTLPKMDNMP